MFVIQTVPPNEESWTEVVTGGHSGETLEVRDLVFVAASVFEKYSAVCFLVVL